MDFSDIGNNLPLVILVVAAVLLQFFLKRRRNPEAGHREIVQSLLSEVRLNQALVESFHLQQKSKKFEVTSWQRNKTKLGFLAQPLQVALSDTFAMVEDFNQQIGAAKKYRSVGYMAGINVDRLKEPLSKGRQGLEEWLMVRVGTKEPPPKYPGVFDDWVGKR